MTLRMRLLTAAAFLCLLAIPARPYSLLTHEQLIDLTWQRSIVPLLLSRYPTLTPAQLDEARAYAYGGCVIQDIGYYPFGDAFFSDLTHYVRTGDFVVALFRNAHNADELAFAVGALSHYIGDSVGHPDATNLAVPIEFPKLAAKYGPSVSYVQGERQHVQTEFAFDINEISHHRMAPIHYLRHIGLMVPTNQLAKSFYETYGLGEDFTTHRGRRFNVRAYRFAVRDFIPRIAYAVNLLHRNHEPVELQSPERLELNREIAAVEVRDDWAKYRRKPGIGTHLLAGLIYIAPKVGPIKITAIKGPTQQTDAAYARSVLLAANTLSARLDLFTPRADQTPAARAAAKNTVPLGSRDPAHPLPDRDLDTGKLTTAGTYPLTDQTFAALLHRLALAPTSPIPATIKQTIIAFYTAPTPQTSAQTSSQSSIQTGVQTSIQTDSQSTIQTLTHSTPAQWAVIQHDLQVLATIPLTTDFAPFPTYPDDPANPDPTTATTPTPSTPAA